MATGKLELIGYIFIWTTSYLTISINIIYFPWGLPDNFLKKSFRKPPRWAHGPVSQGKCLRPIFILLGAILQGHIISHMSGTCSLSYFMVLEIHNSPLKGIGVRDFYRNSIGDLLCYACFCPFLIFSLFFYI